MIKISEPNIYYENNRKIVDSGRSSIHKIAKMHSDNIGFEIKEKIKFLKSYAVAIYYGGSRINVYDKSAINGNKKNSTLEVLLLGKITKATHDKLTTNTIFSIKSNIIEFIDFCDWLYAHINWILLAPPIVLENLKIENISTQFPSWRFDNIYSLLTINSQKYFQNYVLSYKQLTEAGYNGWTNSSLIQKLGTKTCYYCNRQSVIAVTNNGGKKIATPQLDHFFDKSSSPLLALSFYNLIPCCSNCNLKKSNANYNTNTHIHPYEEEFGNDGFFSFEPHTLAASQGESEELEIKFHTTRTEKGKKARRNIDDLGLEDIYTQAHRDFVREMVKRKYISNDRYLEILMETYPNANLNRTEAYQLAFGNYMQDDEFYKRPLAKLTKDIAEDLDLI